MHWTTWPVNDPIITVEDVEKRIRECKKPKGLLAGDLWPELLMETSSDVAPPLTDTINAAMSQTCWPDVWKREEVTIIPKVQTPSSLSETRKISCTPVFSKILEHFVLQQLREEVTIKK